jgi:hypothetical protein
MSTDLAIAQAAAALPPDLAILKLENETIQSLSAARPRDHHTIRQEIVAQLEAYPSFARSAIYNKPVGRDESGQMKFARGLSVRAAEAIAEAYGFCRIRTDVTPIDENSVKVEASFTDYQKGRIWQDGGIVSKFYKDRHGRMARIPDDRFYNVVVKAEVSRRVREVILRSVPPGLRSDLMELAERQIDELLDDATIDKIISKFASKRITLEQLEARIGRTRKSGWTKDDRRDLLGLWNAIEDGETTVAEAFSDEQSPPQPQTPRPAPHGGGASASDLTGGNGNPPAADAAEATPPAATEAVPTASGDTPFGAGHAGRKPRRKGELFDSQASATEAGA